MSITYPRFELPGHPEMFVQVILASRSTVAMAPPLITMHLHYPRIIHSEVMTHRVFSRNARSSRAVPVKAMLEEVRTNPFVPWHWGKNQKGMQAGGDCNEPVQLFQAAHGVGNYWASREDAWLESRDHEAAKAEAYMNAGYHKQIPNRLLEPFAWIHTLITSTSWANFLWLRDHKDAEPHFQDLARLVGRALAHVRENNAYELLKPGDWHLPFIDNQDIVTTVDYLRNTVKVVPNEQRMHEVLRKISAARCARISYKPFDGNDSYEREIERFEELVGGDRLHASPTEHQAMADQASCQAVYTKSGGVKRFENRWHNQDLAGNLGPGWIQFRKMLPGEYVAD